VLNIDILLDIEKRAKAIDKTVLMKGNRELYINTSEMASHNLLQLVELYKTGLSELDSFQKDSFQKHDKGDVDAVIEKLIDISLLFMRSGKKELLTSEKGQERSHYVIKESARLRRISFEKTMIEKAIEEEITLVYFLTLWSKSTENNFLPENDSLKTVLESDAQIREWLSGWFLSLEKYQKDVSVALSERYNEIVTKT
jgi:hypothetical protein